MTMPTPDAKGILQLLGFGFALKTPAFQRSYAWERHQVDDYWNDLKRALDNSSGTTPYFLGLMVVDDADEIQDIQQRLATTLLLASEMYTLIEAAKASGPHDNQLAIDATAQINDALRQSPSTPLVIQPSDQDILLNRAGVSSTLPESARRLKAARQRLRKHLTDDLANRTTPDAQLGRLKQWGEFLRGDAYTILLRVPPKDAHNIFETLNTRGVRLSNGDLVKSHLIGGATATNLAVAKWNNITDALKDAKGNYEDDLETFLPHYYGSRYGKTTVAEFFNDYRAATKGLDSLAALDELLASAAAVPCAYRPRKPGDVLVNGGGRRYSASSRAAKSSFRNEGTRLLTANAVGIRRQAERGADGRRAVDRLGRVVGAGRAVAAGEGAALPLSRSEAAAGSAGAAGDPVCAAHRDLVDASAGRAWFRLGRDLLASPGRVAEGGRVGAAA
jgi:hypothetical protein